MSRSILLEQSFSYDYPAFSCSSLPVPFTFNFFFLRRHPHTSSPPSSLLCKLGSSWGTPLLYSNLSIPSISHPLNTTLIAIKGSCLVSYLMSLVPVTWRSTQYTVKRLTLERASHCRNSAKTAVEA